MIGCWSRRVSIKLTAVCLRRRSGSSSAGIAQSLENYFIQTYINISSLPLDVPTLNRYDALYPVNTERKKYKLSQ